MSISSIAAHLQKINHRQIVCRLQNIGIAAAERSRHFRVRRCSCCGWSGLYFRSFAMMEYLRRDVICPECGSFERHRALSFFYPRFFATCSCRPAHVLHFAPEKCLEPLLRSLSGRYEKSNFEVAGKTELRLDLNRLELPDACYDVLLMNHVLDCMPDDRRAVPEMYRVLRARGTVLAVVGFQPGSKTRDLPVASNRRYRVYGSEDLAERFTPFIASVVNVAGGLDASLRRVNGIPEFVYMIVLRKNGAELR